MKRLLEILLFALVIYGLLTLSSCEKQEIIQEEEEEQVNTSFETDELYSQLDENSTVYDFIDVFIQDAKSYGWDFENQEIQIDWLDSVIPNGGAWTTGSCNDEIISLHLLKCAWDNTCEGYNAQKWTFIDKIKIIYHELGHDLLKLNHICTSGHIMSDFSLPGCTISVTGSTRVAMGDLKYNADDPLFDWKRAVKDMFRLTNQRLIDCN